MRMRMRWELYLEPAGAAKGGWEEAGRLFKLTFTFSTFLSVVIVGVRAMV